MAEVAASRAFPYALEPQFVPRTNEDIYRSLKKYVAIILGDSWDVRLVEEEGTFTRPSALVVPTAVASVEEGDSQFFATMIQPFGIYAYPELGDSPGESRMNALAVEEILMHGLNFGVGEGRARRVPLYNYRGLTLLDTAKGRGPSDFARINDLSVGSLPDPNDRTMWSVSAQIRLSWRRVPTVTSAPGNVVESVTAQPEPTPG